MKKIFWLHPQLRDYRVGLFERLSDLYCINFFFLKKNESDRLSIPASQIQVSKSDTLDFLSIKSICWQDILDIKRGVSNCDIVITSFFRSYFTIIAILFAKIYGKKIIVWEEWYKKNDSKLKYQIRDFAGIFISRFVDGIFTLGPRQEKFFSENGFDKNRIFRANEYPGVVYSHVSPVDAGFVFDESRKYILYLGRLIECKGVDILLSAFKLISNSRSDVSLIVVGDGPERVRLEKMVESDSIKDVHFLGAISDVGMKSYLMNGSTVGVVCSIETENKCDPGPLVTLELLSSGLPVVVSDAVGNSHHVIVGLNGYVYAQRNSEALAECILKVFSGNLPGRDERISAFETIGGFDLQAQVMHKAINSVIGGY